MADNILGTARDRIRKEMNDLADDISLGGCLSADNASMVAVKYAQSSGILEGLARAERHILDVLEEMAKRENFDE